MTHDEKLQRVIELAKELDDMLEDVKPHGGWWNNSTMWLFQDDLNSIAELATDILHERERQRYEAMRINVIGG